MRLSRRSLLASGAVAAAAVAAPAVAAQGNAARFSLGYRHRDGYVRRVFDDVDLGDEDTFFGQAALRWQPSDRLSFTLRGDYTTEDENGSPFVFRTINENATFVAAASVAAGCPGATFPPPFVPPTPDPRCGNDARETIASFASRDGLYRIYACGRCQRYVKAYDSRQAPRPFLPEVDLIATLPLDAAAMQKGFSA